MTIHDKSIAVSLYALAVLASGFVRYVAQEGGSTGLVFGLTMGALALVGAFLLRGRFPRTGLFVAAAVTSLVGGWFVYESFVRKDLADAEVRQLIVIGLSLVMAVVLLWPSRATGSEHDVAPDVEVW